MRNTINRIPINIILYKKGEVVSDTTFASKTRSLRFLQGDVASELKYDGGLCTVIYNNRKRLWNKFGFKNYNEFRDRLSQATEPELIAYVSEGQW